MMGHRAALAALLIGADWLTKIGAHLWATPGVPTPVLGDVLRVTLLANPYGPLGIALGPLTTPLFGTLSVLGALLAWRWWRHPLPGYGALFLTCLFAGAMGNGAERIWLGTVTDFLDLGWGTTRWATFNLADVWLVLGITFGLWPASLPTPATVVPTRTSSEQSPYKML